MSYVDPVHGKDLLDVLEGKLNSKLSQGKPRRMWLDDIRSWTGLDSYEKIKNLANDRKPWRACSITCQPSDTEEDSWWWCQWNTVEIFGQTSNHWRRSLWPGGLRPAHFLALVRAPISGPPTFFRWCRLCISYVNNWITARCTCRSHVCPRRTATRRLGQATRAVRTADPPAHERIDPPRSVGAYRLGAR